MSTPTNRRTSPSRTDTVSSNTTNTTKRESRVKPVNKRRKLSNDTDTTQPPTDTTHTDTSQTNTTNTPHFTESFVPHIVPRLKNIVSCSTLTYTIISTQCNISNGPFSQIIHNKYPFKSTVQSMQNKIRQWLYEFDQTMINKLNDNRSTNQYIEYIQQHSIADEHLQQYIDLTIDNNTRLNLDKLLLPLLTTDMQHSNNLQQADATVAIYEIKRSKKALPWSHNIKHAIDNILNTDTSSVNDNDDNTESLLPTDTTGTQQILRTLTNDVSIATEPLTPNVIQRLRAVMKLDDYTYTTITQLIGISSSALNNLLNMNKASIKIENKTRQMLYYRDQYFVHKLIETIKQPLTATTTHDNAVTLLNAVKTIDLHDGEITCDFTVEQMQQYLQHTCTLDERSRIDYILIQWVEQHIIHTDEDNNATEPVTTGRTQRRASKQASKRLSKQINDSTDDSKVHDNNEFVDDDIVSLLDGSDSDRAGTESNADSDDNTDSANVDNNSPSKKRKSTTPNKSPKSKSAVIPSDLYTIPNDTVVAPRNYTPMFTADYWQCADLKYEKHIDTQTLAMTGFNTISFMNNKKHIDLQLHNSIQLKSPNCVTTNVGGPVSCIAWCPVGNNTMSPVDCDQYIAVATYNNKQYHSAAQQYTTGRHCVQIYNCGRITDKTQSMKLELVILIDNGTIFDLKWLTAGCVWEPDNRLGILAVALGNTTVKVISVPHIITTTAQYTHINNLPHTTLMLQPSVRDCYISTVAWNNNVQPPILAVATSTQYVAIYGLTNIAQNNTVNSTITPTLQFSVCNHLNRVVGLVWHPSNLYQLAVSTTTPSLDIYDLRTIQHPIFTIDIQRPTCKSLYWPAAHSDIIITAIGNKIRLYPLLTPYDRHNEHNQSYHTLSIPAERSLPNDDITYYNDISIASISTNNDNICIAIGTNNGLCNVIAQSWTTIIAEHEKYRSTSLLSVQPTIDSNIKCNVDTSFHTVEITSKSNSATSKLRQKRETQLKYLTNPRDILLSDDIGINCVAINPTIAYPRMIVTGTATGLIQLFNVKDV